MGRRIAGRGVPRKGPAALLLSPVKPSHAVFATLNQAYPFFLRRLQVQEFLTSRAARVCDNLLKATAAHVSLNKSGPQKAVRGLLIMVDFNWHCKGNLRRTRWWAQDRPPKGAQGNNQAELSASKMKCAWGPGTAIMKEECPARCSSA